MKKLSAGFTIIEVLVTVAIIGIISTIGIVSYTNIQNSSRDSQRSSKVAIIAAALEKYFEQNGEYPTCEQMTAANPDDVTAVLEGLDPNVLAAPGASDGINSITSCTGDPTTDNFVYQVDSSGTQYSLKYLKESTSNTTTVASQHASTTTPATPTIAAALNGSDVVATITDAACTSGENQYSIRTHTNDNAWGDYSDWSTSTTSTPVTAAQGVKYYYQAQARCHLNTSNSPTATSTINSYIHPISYTPSAPVVTTTTVGDYTHWDWNAPASCPSGTTAKYQYNFKIYYEESLVWESGLTEYDWTTTGDIDTSDAGFRWEDNVQSRCQNSNTNGPWSAVGTEDYAKSVNYTLTTIAGSGGSVSAGGTYASGSTPTITATPNAHYTFASWTGDTGCSGTASHTITMDANKTCTANFSPINFTLAISANTGGSVNTGVNGSYLEGSTPTITATPSGAGYVFGSWSGGGNCAGTASHTILMDANQTCAANFTSNFFYRATGVYNSAGSTTAVVVKPSGTVDGDLIFVTIQRAAAVNPSSVPAGWTLIRSNLATYGSWLYYKVASSEGASWTWTWAASAKTMGRAHSFYGGFNTSTPIQSSTVPYSGTASATAINIPTLTTSSNNTISLIFSSGYSTSSKTFTVPSNWTEHNDTGNTSPDFWQAIASRAFPTSGTATGVVSYPISAASTYRVGTQVMVNMQ